MNHQLEAVPESADLRGITSASISATRPLYWSVQRELWEYRSVYLGPLGVAAIFLFGFLISMIRLRVKIPSLLALPQAEQLKVLQQPYNFAAALIMGVAFIIQLFYCVEALHSERRDRSMLFWKSLPVSDLTTVLPKVGIPLVILPLLSLLILAATYLIMLLLSTAALLGSGLNVATIWTQLPVRQALLMLLYHLGTVHVLWYAPIYGWLMLVSGWARRMPFLWAVLPPIALSGLERIAFNTSYLSTMLQYRLTGPEDFMFPVAGGMGMSWTEHLDLGRFLSTPGLWIGLAVAAGFLAAAVRQRRYRAPI